MPFVLDVSVAAVWALADESDPLADRLLAEMQTGSALVPGIWWFEIRNVLVTNERRKRLTVDESNAYLRILNTFEIEVDLLLDERAILAYARRHQLSFYDAAYLEVAFRNGLALATLDGALANAARAVGVSLLS